MKTTIAHVAYHKLRAPRTSKYARRGLCGRWSYVVVGAVLARAAAHARQTPPARGDFVELLAGSEARTQAGRVKAFAALCAKDELGRL